MPVAARCVQLGYFKDILGGFALKATMLSALLWGGRVLQQREFASRLLDPSFAILPRPRKKTWKLNIERKISLCISATQVGKYYSIIMGSIIDIILISQISISENFSIII